jgi:hypothetical protein
MQPHEIRGLPQDRVLVLTVEGDKREVAAHALVKKPPVLQLQTVPYEEPLVPTTPPPTIWEERDQQQGGSGGQPGGPSPLPAPLPPPARQPTPDW